MPEASENSTYHYQRVPVENLRFRQPAPVTFTQEAPFGKNELAYYETFKDYPERVEPKVTSIRNKLTELFEMKRTKPYVEKLFSDYRDYQGKIKDASTDPNNISNPNVVNDEILMTILRLHDYQFASRAKEFKRKIPQNINLFREQIKQAQENGAIPQFDVEDRLRGLSFGISDPLISLPQEQWGSFIAAKALVSISEDVPETHLTQVVTHELLHGISGKSAYTRRKNKKLIGNLKTDRLGLRVIDQFKWLNEGITEEITAIACGENFSYGSERALIDYMRFKDGKEVIPLQLFINAYFEDFDPSLPQGKRVPAWKALQKAINDTYSPGFLTRLDREIAENGIKAGHAFLIARKVFGDLEK